jgi:hypothetical protein
MQRNFEYLRLRFLEKKRLRFFSFFFALSFLFWIITKLSNTYTGSINFQVDFVDVPDQIVLGAELEKAVKAEITASGFQLLLHQYFKNRIDISFENADFQQGVAIINLVDQKFALQQQLFQNAILNFISPPRMNIPFSQLKRKKIKVFPPNEIDFRPGYNRSSNWEISPDSIWVYGPSKQIDTLEGLRIQPLTPNIDKDIKEKVPLSPLKSIKFETNKVLIQAEVSRFTEKSLEAFVKIKNLPDSLAIKLFPQSLQVTFLVRVSKADQLKAVDFDFFCDYDQMRYEEVNSIEVFLANEPEGVRNIRWTPKRVDYLIRK